MPTNSAAGPFDAGPRLGEGSGTLGTSLEQRRRTLIHRLMIATGRNPEQVQAAIARHDSDISKYHDPVDPEAFCMVCLYRNMVPMWNAS